MTTFNDLTALRRRMTREEAIEKVMASADCLRLRATETVAALEALGLLKLEEPTSDASQVLQAANDRLARKAIADVNVDDPMERVQHYMKPEYIRVRLGDGYASRIVAALAVAGFKIVRT